MEGTTTTSGLAALEAENADLRQVIERLSAENRWLIERLQWALQRIFGRKSERVDPRQLRLFAEVEEAPEKPEDEEPAPAPRPRKRRRGHGRRKFPDELEREIVRCTLSEAQRTCPDCGETMQEIGADSCERGHIVRPRIVVKRFEKVKYACRSGHAVKVAQAPPALIDKCKYEPSVFAHIAVAKYGDHIPLHRLEGMLRRYRIHLPRSTMWDMIIRLDEILAQPILAQMKRELLQERILLVDETTLTVILEDIKKGQKKSGTGYAWSWRRGRKVVMVFSLSRDSKEAREFLGPWRGGILVSDGTSIYDPVARSNGITRAGCWAHGRRKFKEAVDVGTRAALPIFHLIQRLFRLESAVKKRASAENLTDDQILELCRRVRDKRSRRLVDRIEATALKLRQQQSTLSKSKLGKALGYLKNQGPSLRVFLDEPDVPIHNNASERALRPVVLGRRNWHFVGSPRGGQVAARLYSLIYSCKMAGIDPEAYLLDVLTAVSTTPDCEIARLTPWAWAEAHPEARIAEPHVPA